MLSGIASANQDLPVFLADNHAETFSWIARTFNPDDTFTLVLVDAHSDASAAERSEEIREQLRRVPNLEERRNRTMAWRKSGRIQAFNWIEPLMPRPLGNVFWLAAPVLDDPSSSAKTEEVVSSLDGRLEFEPRSSGTFAGRWSTGDLPKFESFEPGNHKIILAIDLDFFAGMEPEKRNATFSRIWKRAMDWPELAGVAFAVSRPWLTNDEEANALVSLAIGTVSRTRGTTLEIDAEIDTTPDDSLNALTAEREGRKPPRWNFTDAPLPGKTQLALLGNRLSFTDLAPELPSTSARIIPTEGEIDCDEVWRFRSGQEPTLRLEAPAGATGRVRWHALMPSKAAHDLIPKTGLGKSFASSPGRRIYEDCRNLTETQDFQLPSAIWKSHGRIRIGAEYETPEGWLPVPEIELRIRNGDGFLGSLSECFGMPYVFGIGGVTTGALSGVETGWGSDCANFLIHAWRRNGHQLTWGDPARLRSQLEPKAVNLGPDDQPRVSQQEIENGLAVDFGSHVAAVWEDREPIGTLDADDLVVHHLGGFPEIIPLKQLTTSRPKFSLFTPVKKQLRRIRFAGDVVLAGDSPKIIPGFEKGKSDLFIANLEGIPTSFPAAGKAKYDFRFPPDRLGTLRKAGVGLVSLANNHAMDAGPDGLLDGLKNLAEAEILVVGAGTNETAACLPWRNSGLAVFGICIVGGGAAGPDAPGITMLPDHAELLENEFKRARASGETVVVILHGGDEYQPQVNDDQRHWARWLSARGVSVIAGAHPHVTQRTEIHAGTTILHSLGNAIYPIALSGMASGEIRTLEVPIQ